LPVANRILLGYLVLSLPLAVRAGAWATVAMHSAIAGGLLVLRSREEGRWAAIALAPLLYFTLPDLMAGWAGGEVQYRDAEVIGWELALFGSQPARELHRVIPSCVVSEVLHFGYLSYYGLIFVPPLLLWRRGDRAGVELAASALAIAFVASYLVFVAYPVQGPRYLWPDPEGACAGPVRTVVLLVLERGSSRGAAFPSSHVAVAIAQSLAMTVSRLPRVWIVWALSAGLAIGAVYGGFHYAVDVAAGAMLGTAAALLAHSRRITAIRSEADA
jgi:membrane-associated phospholipid phosphatase